MTALDEAQSKVTKSISLLNTMQAASQGAELMPPAEKPSPEDMAQLIAVIKSELLDASTCLAALGLSQEVV